MKKITQIELEIARALRLEALASQPYQCGPRYGQWLADKRRAS